MKNDENLDAKELLEVPLTRKIHAIPFVQIETDEGDFDLQLINEIGQLLFTSQNESRINLSEFSKGVYFLRIQTVDDSYIRKIVVK